MKAQRGRRVTRLAARYDGAFSNPSLTRHFPAHKTKRAISWKMTPWCPKRAIKMASP